MSASLKRFAKNSLRNFNRKFVYAPKGEVSGCDFYEDLYLVIGKENPLCLDIGANEGQTIKLLQKVFKEPTIHSFEPSEKTFQDLQSKKFGDRVYLYKCAMGREQKEQEFINYKSSSQMSSFLTPDQHEKSWFRELEIESKEIVQVNTVDRFLAEKNITHVDLLKIDTQGFDLEVLRGAMETLQSGLVKNVLIELNFMKIYQGQGSIPEIIELLDKHGISLIDFYEKIRQGNKLAWCTALFGK